MTPSSFHLRRGAVVGSALLAMTVAAGAQRPGPVPAAPASKAVSQALNRITFGPRPGDVERVQAMGLGTYIEQQLHPDKINDSGLETRLSSFATLKLSSRELAATYFEPALRLQQKQLAKGGRPPVPAAGSAQPSPENMMAGAAPASPAGTAALATPEAREAAAKQRLVVAELTESRMLRATLSERQLQEVLVDFWLNHFNVFIGKGQVRQYLTEYEREAIRPHVLGRFRDMLGAVAHSPAMLFYLDNFQSAAPETSMTTAAEARMNDPRLNARQRQRLAETMAQRQAQAKRPARGLNENYARELMELHTLGVDAGYTQKDVVELARILTGWTIDQPRNGGSFTFRPAMHDGGTKTFLGVTFAPAGEQEGERALDLLASNPATAHRIAFKLAQRFVADQPPQAVVDRAAKVFLSTKGDLREVVRAILTSPELTDPSFYRAKVKTPLEFVVSAVRATGATLASGVPLVTAMQNLGMPLYGCQPPTGYSMTADAWVNTGALLNRMNFALQLMNGGRVLPAAGRRGAPAPEAAMADAPGGQGRVGRGRGQLARSPISVELAALAPDTSSASREAVVQRLLAGDASDGTRQTLAKAETPQNLVALTLGSPEFQRR